MRKLGFFSCLALVAVTIAMLVQTTPSQTADPVRSKRGDVGTLSCQSQGFGTGDQCYFRCTGIHCQKATCLAGGGWSAFGSCNLYGDWADCPAKRCP